METKDRSAIGYETFVNYEGFDMFKIACQEGGRATSMNLARNGFKELPWSRGESAYVMETPWEGKYLAHVEEGLGTKNVPADRMAEAVAEAMVQQRILKIIEKLAGRSFFKEVSQCNVAMVINDLITSGASPLSFLLHLAVANADWFENKQRWQDVIEGTMLACNIAGCSWGGGETPVLRNVIVPLSCLLSGSAVGFIGSTKRLINPVNIQDGDAIIMFGSSGPHANGYTMLWDVITPRLSEGYLTEIPGDGRTFGEAILAPTFIYSQLVQVCLDAGVSIHYAVNITGHGWCKLMCAVQPFRYVIDKLPRQQPLFDLIHEVNPIGLKKMFRTFNMGGGFAIYVSQEDVKAVLTATEILDPAIKVFVAGHIEKGSEKRVIIEPNGVEFGPEDLVIR